jgi:hypothetical protein
MNDDQDSLFALIIVLFYKLLLFSKRIASQTIGVIDTIPSQLLSML